MSAYGKVNLFLGRYTHGPHSLYDTESESLRLDNANIIYRLQLPSEHAFVEYNKESQRIYPSAPLFLIVEDGDFWPVMIRMPRMD